MGSAPTKVKYVQCHVGVQLRAMVVQSLNAEKQHLDIDLMQAGVMVNYDGTERKFVPWTNIIYADLVADEADEKEHKVKLAKAN